MQDNNQSASTVTAITVFVKEKFPFHRIIALLAASFCAASALKLPSGDFTSLSYFDGFSPFWFVIIFMAAFCGFAALSVKFGDNAAALCTLGSVMALAIEAAVSAGGDIYLNAGIAAVIFMTVKYCAPRLNISFSLSFKTVYIIAAVAAVIATAVTFIGTYWKYASFSTSTYDFGIFAQMFEMMKDTGQPLTTVEREELLSHFAVHFSPFFYLLLPGYFLAPGPEYLLLVQAAAVAAGIFPVIGIARKLGLSSKMSLAAGFFYLLYPSILNGCYYDFHENKFLTVIALYLLYFIVKEKTVPMYIFAVLLLGVKEDAAIYVASIALWMIFSNTRRRHGFGLLALSAVYFVIALKVIPLFGGEVMMGRLSDYYPSGDDSFLAVAKTCFFNIGYLFTKVFTADKIPFILWMLIPAAAAPFAAKKASTLLLMIPMLVINLMPSWQYQYDVNFQYTYGVAALVVFSFVLLLSAANGDTRRRLILFGVCCAAVFSFSLWIPKYETYSEKYLENKEYYDQVSDYLYSIPEDATVTASNFLVPHLYQVDELYGYIMYYGTLQKTDYYLLDQRYHILSNEPELAKFLSDGYELVDSVGFVDVYRLTEQ
jgi:uncharacterized membrane protein